VITASLSASWQSSIIDACACTLALVEHLPTDTTKADTGMQASGQPGLRHRTVADWLVTD
jgi:hypothetical protein